MKGLNRDIETVTDLDEMYLAGNPIDCSCDASWLAHWLVNFVTPSGVRIIKDYMNVTCSGGSWNGTRVNQLDAMRMGCIVWIRYRFYFCLIPVQEVGITSFGKIRIWHYGRTVPQVTYSDITIIIRLLCFIALDNSTIS